MKKRAITLLLTLFLLGATSISAHDGVMHPGLTSDGIIHGGLTDGTMHPGLADDGITHPWLADGTILLGFIEGIMHPW